MINQAARAGSPPDAGQPQAAEAAGRRAQILDAALQVMAERGFRGASIKRIAERAGLKSPALIYWYFKDKRALFEATLDELAPVLAVVADADALLDLPPEQVLSRLVDGFMRTVEQPVIGRFARVLLSEAARDPSVGTFFAERGPMVVLGFLERYFARQVELGRMRPHNPATAARALMGMLVVYLLGREVVVAVGAGFPAPAVYGAEITAIFLNGLATQSGAGLAAQSGDSRQ
jgi:AcrR family transcriptional regulator